MNNNNYNNEHYFLMRIRGNLHHRKLNDFFKLMNLSKAKIQYLIKNNCCFVNGELSDETKVLNQNDYLMIDITNFEKIDYSPVESKLDILYEDDYLLIINKPSGHIIYSNDSKTTIANYIANYYHKIELNSTIRHCHRLDTDTTGCLVYAKDIITHSAMSKMFEENKIKKTYLAISEGIIVKDGIIATPIGKDRHTNGKMIVYNKGQNAKTTYKVLSNNHNTSLLSVEIETGRTHQIRVHLSSILHPLYGDKLYGAVTDSRVMLHCYRLNFVHPILGTRLEITSKIPQDFNKVLKKEGLSCDKLSNLI